MKRKRMGRTGLKVSEICLGTMTFGMQCDEASSFAIMDTAFEQGIDFFDTAEIYGPHTNEELVGRALAGRSDVIVATKFGFMLDPQSGRPVGVNSKPAHIKQVADASLKRLRTDQIDLCADVIQICR